MNVNADIIFEYIGKSCRIQRFGAECRCLPLQRVLFLDLSLPLSPENLYLTDTNTLNENDIVVPGLSFLCVGDVPSLRVLESGSCILALKDYGHPLQQLPRILNAVQDVFAFFDSWDKNLQHILDSSISIREMVECSIPVFRNPLFINNQDLKVIVSTLFKDTVETGRGFGDFIVEDCDILASTFAVNNLRSTPNYTSARMGEYDLRGQHYVFVQMQHQSHNLGVLTLSDSNIALRSFDKMLLEHLAGYIEKAMHKQDCVEGDDSVSQRSLFKSLLQGSPIHEYKVRNLLSAQDEQTFVCICLKPIEHGSSIPFHYIYDSIRLLFPSSISFKHDNLAVCFLKVDKDGLGLTEAMDKMEGFLAEIKFHSGVSYPFTDVFEARDFFLQARCALMTGSSLDPRKPHYLFSDYALPYALQNSLGVFRPRHFCPPGLLRLHETNGHSCVNYWETLRILLDSEMNVARAAKALYLHRSTMLQRLERIKAITGIDFDDPKQRLYIQICMHTFDVT
jgi:hypothetical protein